MGHIWHKCMEKSNIFTWENDRIHKKHYYNSVEKAYLTF